MGYLLQPTAAFWADGVICVPRAVCEKHLRFADENKLKALLLLISKGGACVPEELSDMLGISRSEAEECLEFWVEEGILVNTDDNAAAPTPQAEPMPQKTYEVLPMPNLTPRDIVAICGEREELAGLLRTAEKVLMSGLSNAMKSNIINMVTYYGLPVPVVVTLLNYYKSERDAGRNITTRKLHLMAKEWADDAVDTLDKASQKLEELVGCEELWDEVLALCDFEYRKPTPAQLKMLRRWREDFDTEMISFACNVMKKYTEEERRSLKSVDNILKEWKRKGLKTPADVKAQPKKDAKKDGKLKGKPSFDIEEIKKDAVLNDDFDI